MHDLLGARAAPWMVAGALWAAVVTSTVILASTTPPTSLSTEEQATARPVPDALATVPGIRSVVAQQPESAALRCPEPVVVPWEGLGWLTLTLDRRVPIPVTVNFGDGQRAYVDVERIAAHRYTAPGTYVVEASSWSGPDGRSTVARCAVTVQPPPVSTPTPRLSSLLTVVPDGSSTPTGAGSLVWCADGTTSTAGGHRGACSWHGGIG